MAGKKISELTPLSEISGDEKVPVAVGGENFNVDLSSLKDYTSINVMPMQRCESDEAIYGDDGMDYIHKTVELSVPQTGFIAGDIKLQGRFDDGYNELETRSLGFGVLYFMDVNVVDGSPFSAVGFFVGSTKCLRITYSYPYDSNGYWTIADLSHSDRMTQSVGGEYDLAFVYFLNYNDASIKAIEHNLYAGHIRLWDLYAMSDAGDYTTECLFEDYGILRIDKYERGDKKYYRGTFVSEAGNRYNVSLDKSEEEGEYGPDIYMLWRLDLLPDLEDLGNRVDILETDYNWVESRLSTCEDWLRNVENIQKTLAKVTITRL